MKKAVCDIEQALMPGGSELQTVVNRFNGYYTVVANTYIKIVKILCIVFVDDSIQT